MTVLVIDDDEMVLDLIQDVLSEKHRVYTAYDALAAADAIGLERPDMIITDLQLPVLTGSEFIHIIRGHREFDSVPIVAMSAYPNLFQTLDAQQVQGFLAEPFEITEVARLVADSLSYPNNHHDLDA